MSRMRRLTSCAVAVCAVMLITRPATAQEEFVLNLRDADVTVLVEQVSEFTGRTLVLSPDFTGNVSVVSSEPLDMEGIWSLFQSILRTRGFVAVQSGPIWEVIPEAEALARGGPLGAGDAGDQDIVTQLVRLNALPATEAVRVLEPLVDENGYIQALPDANAVIVTDSRANVQRIVTIARSFDSEGLVQTEVVEFLYADANDVADAIGTVLGEGAGTRISVEERSNRLLVRGLPREISEIRRLALELDVRPKEVPGTVRVTQIFRLSHAEAEDVAKAVQGLLGGGRAVTSARGLSEGGLTFGERLNTPQDQQDTETPETTPTTAEDETLTFGATVAEAASVQAAPESNAIIVRGTRAQIEEVASIIRELDRDRPQILIEAAIVEVSGDIAQRLGVQLGLGGAATSTGSFGATSFNNGGTSLSSVVATLGAPATGVITTGLSLKAGGNDFNVLVQALNQSTRANLLSTPSVMTLDNRPATIVVGQNVPFRTGSFLTDGATVTPFETIERRDVGITMEVLPRISGDGVVKLEIAQEVSAVVNTTVEGAADLITNRRVINTTVEAADGGTVVLGGLITDDRQRLEQKVPGLGDVPIVGGLFRQRVRQNNRRTLFVFLRPTVIRTSTQGSVAAKGRLERLRGEEQRPAPRTILEQDAVEKLPLEINGLY